MKTVFCWLACLLCFFVPGWAQDLVLKDKLNAAKAGDYIVTAQGRLYTMLHIFSKERNKLILEEINVPQSSINLDNISWKKWVEDGAPGNSSWVMYNIDLSDGMMSQPYSFTANRFFMIPESDNFLSQLLNLRMELILAKDRKRSGAAPDNGAPDWRPIWQPPLIFEGKTIQNAFFNAYKARWPRDNTELSGKVIIAYLPDTQQKVPNYFPYWLEISGLVGKAKIRIIDSGTGLVSPKDANFVKDIFNPKPVEH